MNLFSLPSLFHLPDLSGLPVALAWQGGLPLRSVFACVVGSALLVWLLRQLGALRHRSLERELLETRHELEEIRQDQKLLTEFIREFPDLSQELHSRLTARQLPGILLRILDRAYRPQQALVMLRRKAVSEDGEVRKRLVVVGALSSRPAIELGTEVVPGRDTIGFIARSQCAFERGESRPGMGAPAADGRTPSSLRGLVIDLAAPMVFHEETVGALLVSGPRRRPAAAKDLLRLIAQVGSLTLFSVSSYRRVKRDAERDRLTGIFNKISITRLLSEEVVEAERRGQPLSVFLFDIDHFKCYNDTNGHPAGDELLARLPQLVLDVTRAEDLFGRFGGEEFLLVLPNTDCQQALSVAEKIRRRIGEHPFPHGERQPLGCVSISGGIASFPRDGREGARLLRLADEALYAAKRSGRNRIRTAPSSSIGAAAM